MFGLFKKKGISVGWIVSQNFCDSRACRPMWPRKPQIKMRHRPVDFFINYKQGVTSELYNPKRRYDVVVFLKIMSDRAKVEAEKIKRYGGKVIFDANVNYYEVWGDYPVPGTLPTKEQKKQAIWMTENADFVVADSSYIRDVCLKYNDNVLWIPDSMDTVDEYKGLKKHVEKDRMTLIWSGQAKKAYHFELIEECLYHYANKIKLLIVSNEKPGVYDFPDVVGRMKNKLNCETRAWDPGRYPADLLESDVIISPKILNNGYESGHSEYKITLGMAQRLPVIASNQRSYIEAFNGREAGFICEDENGWYDALGCLLDSATKRQEMGDVARGCVEEGYSVVVTSKKFLEVFKKLRPV